MNTEPKQNKEKKDSSMSIHHMRRNGMAVVMSLLFVAIMIAANVLISALVDRYPSMKVDLTSTGVNTLSEQSLSIAKSVKNETQIIFIGEEGNLRSGTYGSAVTLAERLQEANSLIQVSFVDPDKNPAFINEYASDNLTYSCILVSTEKRHKVLRLSSMISSATDSTTGESAMVSTADTDLASALEMVNLDTVPVIAAITGHDEVLSSSARSTFDTLMSNENFDIQEVDLLTQEIPQEANVLFLGAPTTDFSAEELAKLRAYLEDDLYGDDRTVLLTCYPNRGAMPNFDQFLEEWGVKLGNGTVLESDAANMVTSDGSGMLVTANTENILTDNTYNRLITLMSVPITLTFSANNDISTQALWTTADTAFPVETQEDYDNPAMGVQNVATLSTKLVQVEGSYHSRYLAVFGSSHVFSPSVLSSNNYGDQSYIKDFMHYVTNTDDSAVTVSTTTKTTASQDLSITQQTVVVLGLGVFTVGIPLIILIFGIVIFVKRRHL